AVVLAAAFLAAALVAGLEVFTAPAPVPRALAAPVFAAAVLRGGYLDSRCSNSKLTLPASLSQARKALNARRVRMLTNLSSRSVLPVASSFCICARSTGCCRMTLPLLKVHEGAGCCGVGTARLHT